MTRLAVRSWPLGLATLAVMACSSGPQLEPSNETTASVTQAVSGETHPYQPRLMCERAPGNVLVGVMYDVSSGSKSKVAEFDWGGNVGDCELAVRAARNNKVCISEYYGSYTIRDLGTKTNSGSYSNLSACTSITKGSPTLKTQAGYVDFIPPNELAPFRDAIPSVADATIDGALKSSRTMFYDEAALTFVYQDSFGDPRGLRANRVGYDVGSNADEPDIHALVEYFQPGKFKFPFSIAAGATFADNIYVLDFWQPPLDGQGKALPVKIAQNASHWQWVFPVGTVVGELFYIQSPDRQWIVFEVRARIRELTGWATHVFRPYVRATDLAAAIKAKRPDYTVTDLKALVDHLEANDNLTPTTLSSPSYAAIFPAMQGALDYLPGTSDTALIKELLTGKTFEDAMGVRWKENATLKTYAASTHASFHIVPAEYTGGMFETSQNGCRRCHDQTSRPLNNLDSRVVLYGEVWGEDEVFTWHPFAIDAETFSVADGNRHINQRLVTAGLVQMGSLTSDPTHYQALPKPYQASYE